MKNYATCKESAEFSRRMKLLMSIKGKTLSDIAEYTGNAVSTVSTWRRGRIPKSEKAKNKLADALGVKREQLYIKSGAEIFSNESPASTGNCAFDDSAPPESRPDSADTLARARLARRRIQIYFERMLSSTDNPDELEKIYSDLRVFFPHKKRRDEECAQNQTDAD